MNRTFEATQFIVCSFNIGARIARPPRLWKVCDIWRTASTPPRKPRGNVLLSQVFNHVLSPPQAAHMVEPNQVHSLTWLNTI